MRATESGRFAARKLVGSERPAHRYEYYVTGKGHFPFDMLRYDSCWPATGDDVAKLDIEDRELRSIKLCSYREPTIGRWASFFWSVGKSSRYMPHHSFSIIMDHEEKSK